MGWTIGVLEFDSRWGLGIFLFAAASGVVLGPARPAIQWVPGALSLEVGRPGRGADHSPPSSAEVKEWVRLYGVVLKAQGQLYFTHVFYKTTM
jgi:hypothetical protein